MHKPPSGIGAGKQPLRKARARAIALVAALACAGAWLAAFGGVASAAGIAGYVQVSNPVSVGLGTSTQSVSCPGGDVIVGGGFQIDPAIETVFASQPVDTTGTLSNSTWYVSVDNFNPSGGTAPLTVYGVCVASATPGYTEQIGSQSLGSGLSGAVDATCPVGDVVVGGGFGGPSTIQTFSSNWDKSSTQTNNVWESFFTNPGRASATITSVAVCLSNTVSGYAEPSASSFVPASQSGTETAACATGSVPLGGGFSIETPTFVEVSSTAPASASWSVGVTNTDGASARLAGVQAVCAAPAPVVTAVNPALGPAAGGTPVTITGSHFTGATAVDFGSTSATFTVVSDTQINATAPAGSGAVDVTVTTGGGTSATGAGDIYKYVPSVTGVSPSSGPTTGGTSVTITGTGFTGATAVKFGATAATSFTVNNATKITATSPAGSAATVAVTVTTPGGTSATSASDHFTFVTPPTVTGVSPSSGPTTGGTSVTITGTGFTGATAVKFGATATTSFTVNNATKITATSPAGSAATVAVTVTTPGGTSATSASDHFMFVTPPTVTGVSPSSGPTTGGTSVTITGTGFTGATTVKFGATTATSFTVNSATKITATSPAGSAATVHITVTTPGGGTSATGSADGFTYVSFSGPTVSPGPPEVLTSTSASLSGSVNPEGRATTADFEYGLDPSFTGGGAVVYDQKSQTFDVGSGSSAGPVATTLIGLVPHALYHVRLVATSSAGTTFGPDQTFQTAQDPPPPPPVLGQSENVTPVEGLVFIKFPAATQTSAGSVHGALTKGAGFQPLTEPRQIPDGSQIDARRGTLSIAAATNSTHKKHAKLQKVTASGAIFSFDQSAHGLTKGLTTLKLLEGAFPGAPSYADCSAKQSLAAHASRSGRRHPHTSHKVLQTLQSSDNHGQFGTKTGNSSATVRGTVWDTVDRCDGTLTIVRRGSVRVRDFGRRKTVTVHAHHRYLARRLP